MAGPITWQNVNGPSNADVFRGLNAAQDSIGGAFSAFNKILTERQVVNQGTEDRARVDSQQGFLDMIDGAKTPEELAALRVSGALDQRLAGMDPRARAAVRGATDARLASLQTQTATNNNYVDQAQLRAQRPIEEQILVARAQGNTALADQLTTQLTRNQGTFLEANRVSGRTRAIEGQTDALAAIKGPTELATARSNAELQPAQAAFAKRELELKGATLTAQQKQVQDADEDRAITASTARLAQEYKNQQLTNRTALGGLAAQLKLPVTASGEADLANMTAQQKALLDTGAKTNGLGGIDKIYLGDTAVVTGFLGSIQGKFTPEAVARNTAAIQAAFNSTANGAPVGNDLLAARTQQAAIDVDDAEKSSKNWYAPGSENATKNYEEISKEVTGMYAGKSKGELEDLPHVQNYVHKMATVGVKVGTDKEGKDILLVPSKEDILASIRGTEGNWWFDNSRAQRSEAKLLASLSDSRRTKLIEEAEQLKVTGRRRAIRALLADQGSPPKK